MAMQIRTLAEVRIGCWCATYRKCCEYHNGFQDAREEIFGQMYDTGLKNSEEKKIMFWTGVDPDE